MLHLIKLILDLLVMVWVLVQERLKLWLELLKLIQQGFKKGLSILNCQIQLDKQLEKLENSMDLWQEGQEDVDGLI